MSKSAYIIVGIAAALIAAFIVATQWYRSAEPVPSQKSVDVNPPSDASLVRADSPSLGPMTARVTLVEFLDPECESCRAMHPFIKRILKEHEGGVRLVVRYMPLHRNSVYAAAVLEAAGEQGRYWEMLDILFEHQPEWGDHRAPKPELILELAARIGVDMKALEQSLKNPAHAQKVQRDAEDGKKLRVMGTPTFFVNGTRLQTLGYEPLKAQIQKELSK